MRRALMSVLMSVLVLTGCSATTGTSFDPDGRPIADIADALRNGRTSSGDLVQHYLQRIERYDDRGPGIEAVISLNPDALSQARDRDEHRMPDAGPLYGIPFVVKDNIDVAGLPTTGGSAALGGNVATRNAGVVQRLLDAGAIVLGKTNMSELATSYGHYGYSSAGGQTKNPYNLLRSPSGSSSGTAAAVAADFAPFGLGTDTTGSIRVPASVTGQVGLRSTSGLVSRAGVLPLSSTFDTVGAITHTAADQQLVLDTIAGLDQADPATLAATHQPADPGPDTFRDRRIGVVTAFTGGDPSVDAAFGRAIDTIRGSGAATVPVTLGPETTDLGPTILSPVGDAELADAFAAYMSDAPTGVPRTLQELLDRSTAPEIADSAHPVIPERLEGYRVAAARAGTEHSPDITRVLQQDVPALQRSLARIFEEERLDALVFATTPCSAAVRFDARDDSYRCAVRSAFVPSYLASASGLPQVSVPTELDGAGVPIGLSFLGTAFSERRLLALARAWENRNGRLPDPSATP